MLAAAPIAKLTRPRLHNAMQRERLFQLLDEQRARPAIWISAPPGAGKTTLVASYLEARKLPGIWYQVDQGDADPAAFFHYLALAVGSVAKATLPPLPILQPEHMADLPGFARRFFREAWRRLNAPVVIVLDNYQEVHLESAFHAMVVESVEQMPAAINLIVVSRTVPPRHYARQLANGLVGDIPSTALRLNREETAALATAHQRIDAATLDTLHARANGWVAGVVLLAEHVRHTSALEHGDQAESMETLFAYFAGEVFSQVSVEVRQFLLRTAFLPQITVTMAEALTGNPDAAAILDDLFRRNWFTNRRFGAQTSYQYHGLFREFLIAHAEATLIAVDLVETKRLAAALLTDNDQTDVAISLFAQIQDWGALTRLVVAQAKLLTSQGRYTTLLDWISLVPKVVIAQTPWLLLWRGRACMAFDQSGSLPDLEQAFALFNEHREPVGIFLAWGSISNAIIWDVAGDQRRLDPWMARIEDLRAEYPDFVDPAIDWLVAYTVLCILYLREPQNPRLDDWRGRALALAHQSGDVTQHLPTLHIVLLVNLLRGDHARAALDMAEYPQVGEVNLREAQTALLYFGRAYFESRMGEFETCLDTVEKAIAASEASGIHAWDHQVMAHGVTSALSLGDHVRAGLLLDRIAADPRTRSSHPGSYYHTLASWYAYERGEGEKAVVHARAAVECADPVGALFLSGVARMALAQALHAQGEGGAARQALAESLAIARNIGGRSLEHMCRMVEADFDFAAGDSTAGDAALREGLRLGRDEGYISFPFWRKEMMARLCARALEVDSDVDYVRHIVRFRQLRAPSPDIKNWPWPIRVYTLGRFAVLKDDVPISASGKTQKKPLELLKALIALGGRGVAAGSLAEALWEDSGEGTARHALDMAVSRLRKLLGDDGAILIQEGKLTLNDKLVWIDAYAFERLAGDFKKHLGDAGLNLAQQAVERYTGAFLAGDEEVAWLLGRRDSLRSRYLRLVSAHGSGLERLGKRNQAIDGYRRALELEPLAETIYQSLMRCHLELDEPAQALETYRRCRQMLSIVLSVSPNPQIEKLAERARCR